MDELPDEGTVPFTMFVIDSKKLVFDKELTTPEKGNASFADIEEVDDAIKIVDHKKVKKLLRLNYWPPEHQIRKNLWWKLCDIRGKLSNRQAVYSEMVKEVFGEADDELQTTLLPPFVDYSFLVHHNLSENGINVVRKILCIIAHERPDIVYSPVLFTLVSVLLHYMNEQDCYDCVSGIVGKCKERYVTQTRISYEASGLVLKKLAMKYAKVCCYYIEKSGAEVEAVFEHWIWWIFKFLPFNYLVRVMDCFLYEGPKVLYRVGLSILINFYKHKGKSSPKKTLNNVTSEIEEYCSNIPISARKLLRTAFGLRGLSRSQMSKLILKQEMLVRSRENVAILQTNIPNSPSAGSLNMLVTRDTGSQLVSKKDWREIYSWLPKRFTLKQPSLIFSTCEHGTSLNTFYSKVEGHEPTFIAIKTNRGEIIGAYCSGDWSDRKSRSRTVQYFGTGESFVCILSPKRVKYSWIGLGTVDKTANSANLFATGDATQISIGGGNGHAIMVDENLLQGTSSHCDTFNNPPLVENGSFTVTVLEVFAFD